MKKKEAVNIRDIARELNISGSTVSRALNNNPRISEKTRKAVREMAKQMGYQPNAVASNLPSKHSNTIGVIVPRLSQQFISSAIDGIEEHTRAKGYRVLICQSKDVTEREIDCVQTLCTNQVDGIISCVSLNSESYDHYKLFTNNKIPVVFFDGVCDEIETTKVIVDDFKGGFLATEHLTHKGCQRIAHIGGPQHQDKYINRFQGYLKALRKHKLAIADELMFFNDLSQQNGLEAAEKLLRLPHPPDAIFAANDTAALGVILYAREKGIRIPQDLALVGFNNAPFSEYLSPSLTTIEQSGFDIGIKTAELLLDMIQNKGDDKQETIVLPVKLIERESSDRKKNCLL